LKDEVLLVSKKKKKKNLIKFLLPILTFGVRCYPLELFFPSIFCVLGEGKERE